MSESRTAWPDLMTSKEVAVVLRLSRKQVTRLAHDGRIPSIRITATSRPRFRRSDIERLIGSSEAGP